MNLEIFPDQVLLTEILPNIPLRDLLNICSTNIRFRDLCREELLWMIKFRKQYPNFIKPENITWRQLYLDLNIKNVDVYVDGDVVGNIRIYIEDKDDFINNYDDIINLISNEQLGDNFIIIYTDRLFYPVLLQCYPDIKTKTLNKNINDIDHIIILNGALADEICKTSETKITRGRKPVNKILHEERKTQKIIDRLRFNIIESVMKNKDFYGYVEQDGKLNIVENFDEFDMDSRSLNRGRYCQTYPKEKLLDIIYRMPLAYLVENFGYEYHDTLLNLMRHELCNIIYNYLRENDSLIYRK